MGGTILKIIKLLCNNWINIINKYNKNTRIRYIGMAMVSNTKQILSSYKILSNCKIKNIKNQVDF